MIYSKRIDGSQRPGHSVNAEVLKKDITQYAPAYSGGKVTRYRFNVKYTDSNGITLEGVFSTDNRAAKKIKERDSVCVYITDNEIILKEDMPTKAGVYFLLISGAVSFGLFVLGIVCEYI